ncbi:MAG: hypothetical protein GXN93_00895 [Candidatus Diapherotrites archaeon]|nr:hypothetical protein [Candidatus Diapherotrites archaeon]
MERSQLAGLIITAVLVLSSLVYIVAGPRGNYVAPGTYSGTTVGKLVKYVDREWVIPTAGVDLNGLPVVQEGQGFVFISVSDVNKTLDLLREKNVPFFLRDAIVSAPVKLGDKTQDLNVYAFVQPDLNVGDLVRISYQVTVGADGTVRAIGQEVGGAV